jgi:hypothetical protein
MEDPRAFLPPIRNYWLNNYFKEQYSTVFGRGYWHDGTQQHPEIWYWQKGTLTNHRDGDREFLYLHLMNFLKPWNLGSGFGDRAVWEKHEHLLHFDPAEIEKGVVEISPTGFNLIDESQVCRVRGKLRGGEPGKP